MSQDTPHCHFSTPLPDIAAAYRHHHAWRTGFDTSAIKCIAETAQGGTTPKPECCRAIWEFNCKLAKHSGLSGPALDQAVVKFFENLFRWAYSSFEDAWSEYRVGEFNE